MLEPIHVDITATKKHYKHLDSDELLVTSTFLTLQGEGPFAGRRAFFIRLAGCNFGGKGVAGPGCQFCDTKFHYAEGKRIKFNELLAEVLRHCPEGNLGGSHSRFPLVVITGGEPLLQKNLNEFILHLYGTYHGNIVVQIESNGTVQQEIPEATYLVVSPKVPENVLASSIPKYSKPSSAVLQRANCLKILVSADPSSPYHEIPKFVHDWRELHPSRPVYLSPINVYRRPPFLGEDNIFNAEVYDHKAIAANHSYAATLCIKYSFVLSTQTHLLCALL